MHVHQRLLSLIWFAVTTQPKNRTRPVITPVFVAFEAQRKAATACWGQLWLIGGLPACMHAKGSSDTV